MVEQGLGGYLEMYTSGSNAQMAVCRGWGCMYICTEMRVVTGEQNDQN